MQLYKTNKNFFLCSVIQVTHEINNPGDFMKTFLALVLLTSFSAMASTTLRGVILQAECNRPTGFGVIEIAVKNGKAVDRHHLNVNSKKLCSDPVSSATIPGATVLGEIAFNNFLSDKYLSEVIIEDGFIVDAENVEKVRPDYLEKGTKKVNVLNAQEAMNWYFSNRRSY